MAEIIPAILPKSFEDLQEKIRSCAPYVKTVQIDVCDGFFVANKTWPYNENGDKHFDSLLKEEEGLPAWDSLNFEVDMMVAHPEREYERYIMLGAARLIIHKESVSEIEKLIEEIRNKYGSSKDSLLAPQIFLSSGSDTPLEELFPLLGLVDGVQLMGIANIGFQGLPFDERVLRRIETLRARDEKLLISIDGGVNKDTAEELITAGANHLVIGSAIFGSGSVKENIEWFQSL